MFLHPWAYGLSTEALGGVGWGAEHGEASSALLLFLRVPAGLHLCPLLRERLQWASPPGPASPAVGSTPPAASPSGCHKPPTRMPRDAAILCTQTMGMFSYFKKDFTIQECSLILLFTMCGLFNMLPINSVERQKTLGKRAKGDSLQLIVMSVDLGLADILDWVALGEGLSCALYDV